MQRFICGLLLALGAAVPAGASTFLYMPQEELVLQADSVVQGKIIEASSFWNEDRTAILTEAVLEVEDAVVGAAPAYVNLRTFGGRVGNYVIEAHGFPRFAVGDRLLLFLEPETQGAHRVLGYQQGQLRIRVDERGRAMAIPMLDLEARVLTRDGKAAPVRRAVLLEDLKRELRETAGRVGRPAVQ